MRIRPLLTLGTAILGLAWAVDARAHCEIPCGIYDDQLRVSLMAEHITTIEKSMQKVNELGAAKDKDFNQIVRWVTNKDEHAGKLQEIVFQYFMTQRIKPADPKDAAGYAKYIEELTLLHGMLIQVMKAKQTTDLGQVRELRQLLARFSASYFSDHAH